MTPGDDDTPAGDDDMLAAEYVIGVLAPRERELAAERMRRDAQFTRLVEAWEARLAPLGASYPEIAPPSSVKQAIDHTLDAGAGVGAGAGRWVGLWRSLGFWRGVAAVAVVLLVVAVAVPRLGLRGGAPVAGTQFVAAIAPQGSGVSYLAWYDPRGHSLALSHVSGERGAGHDFELWAIAGKAAPVSLGVIPAGQVVHLKVAAGIASKLAAGAVLAISREAAGGSPVDHPLGPVVAAGGLNRI